MANAIASQVQALYVGYLGRAADQAGLDFWTNAITAGTSTIESVALGFTLSQEYTSKYEGLSNEELAAAIYQNVLGRAADADGLAFWVGELEKGVQTPETLLAAMINSLGAVDQKVIDNKVYVANAYTAAAGADYKAEAGAKILEGVDGTAASVAKAIGTLPTSTATLTERLATWEAAKADVTEVIDAWGAAQTPAKAAGVATAAEIYVAVDTAEAAVDAFLSLSNGASTNGNVLGITMAYDDTSADDVYNGGSSTDKIGTKNAAEDAALAVIKAQIAAKELSLDSTVSSTTTALLAREVAGVKVGADLKAAVDAYMAAQDAATAARTAEANAFAATQAAAATLNAGSDAITDVSVVDGFTGGTPSVATKVITVVTAAGTYTSTYNTSTKVWANDDVALNAFDLTDLQTKVVAEYTAEQAIVTADSQVLARLLVIEKIDPAQTTGIAHAATGTVDANSDGWDDGDDTPALTFETDSGTDSNTLGLTASSLAEAYANAAAAVKTFDKAVTAFNAKVAAVDAARADSVDLAAAQKAVTDAAKAISDEGVNVVSLAGTGAGATAFASATKSDVILLESTLSTTAGAATVYNFDESDVLFVGSKYVVGTATDYQKANDAAFEVFFKQDGGNTLVTVETKAFGDTANANQVSEITLVGVSAADLELSDGFIQLA